METRKPEETSIGGAARNEKGAPGNLFIVSAPSGAGKSTLCGALRQRFARIRYSVSYTTRKPRPGEVDGVHYHFIDVAEFRRRIDQDAWAEWAEVHGNYYGTSADLLAEGLAAGEDILLEIDVQGAAQIAERFEQAVTIFILPPSMEALEARLRGRDSDSDAVIEKRLVNARTEMAQKDRYRHRIVNDDLETAKAELFAVVERYITAGS